MNKEDLEIAKKIAEIECVGDEVAIVDGEVKYLIDCCMFGYNPFDWSVLGPLMIKHKVQIEHVGLIK